MTDQAKCITKIRDDKIYDVISALAEPVPKIDFTVIDFPTDKITVKDVRRAYKLGYDLWWESRFDDHIGEYRRHMSLDDAIDALIHYERDYAEQAFLQALGVPVREGREYVLQDVVDTVRSEYLKLGLATGDHQVAELVRGVERQAVAQANQYLGRRP